MADVLKEIMNESDGEEDSDAAFEKVQYENPTMSRNTSKI